MIKIENLNKSYNGIFNTLTDISLSVKAGECIILFGEEGAGKSTLLDIIAGIKDYEGNVEIENISRKDIKEADIKLSYNKYIPVVFNSRSVLYNLKYYFKIYEKELPKKEVLARIEEVSKKFGIFDKLKRRAGGLSLEDKFYLTLARSYLKKPAILLLDLPCKLDSSDFAENLMKYIKLFSEDFKSTIIIACENFEIAKAIKLPIYFMYFGTLFSPEIIGKADEDPLNFEIYKLFSKPLYIEEFRAIRHLNKVEFFSPNYKFFVKNDYFESVPEFVDFDQNIFIVASKIVNPFENTKNVEILLSDKSKIFIFDKITGFRIL